MPINPLNQFKNNISKTRELGVLHASFRQQTTQVLDLSDILRAEIVMAVSALDHLIHEMVLKGMLDIHYGLRAETPSFHEFPIKLDQVKEGLGNLESHAWLENSIRERHGWQTFVQPDKISGAIRLIVNVDVWIYIAGQWKIPPQDLKSHLKIIVDRRNKISHEADVDRVNPSYRWSITESEVNEAVEFIERLGVSLYEACGFV